MFRVRHSAATCCTNTRSGTTKLPSPWTGSMIAAAMRSSPTCSIKSWHAVRHEATVSFSEVKMRTGSSANVHYKWDLWRRQQIHELGNRARRVSDCEERVRHL